MVVMVYLVASIANISDNYLKVAESKQENLDLLNTIRKTSLQINGIYANTNSSYVNFTMTNEGNTKFWDFEKFELILKYDTVSQGKNTTKVITTEFYPSKSFINSPNQFARPVSDVEVNSWLDVLGGNAQGDLYDEIDEEIRNDGDFVNSILIPTLGTESDSFVVNLGNTTDPQLSEDHFVRYSIRKSADLGDVLAFDVKLLQTNTTLASWTHFPTDVYFQANQELLASQTDLITNYDDLRLNFTIRCVGASCAGPGLSFGEVSWAEVEIPATSCSLLDSDIPEKSWIVDHFVNDQLDPQIFNSGERALICVKIPDTIMEGGQVSIIASTEHGVSTSKSIMVN